MFRRSKRKQLEELCTLYKERIEKLEKQLADSTPEFVIIRPPEDENLQEYARNLAEIVQNPYYQWFFEDLRRQTVMQFEQDKATSADFYRGKLSILGDISQKCVDAARHLLVLRGEPQNEA